MTNEQLEKANDLQYELEAINKLKEAVSVETVADALNHLHSEFDLADHLPKGDITAIHKIINDRLQIEKIEKENEFKKL